MSLDNPELFWCEKGEFALLKLVGCICKYYSIVRQQVKWTIEVLFVTPNMLVAFDTRADKYKLNR